MRLRRHLHIMANPGLVLWTLPHDAGALRCVVTGGCAVVVLTVEQGSTVLVREAYPDRATAGERARMLRSQYEG